MSDPAGSQLYVLPEGPDATRIVELPLQMLTEGLAVTEGVEMLMVTMSESEQPFASVM